MLKNNVLNVLFIKPIFTPSYSLSLFTDLTNSYELEIIACFLIGFIKKTS